jgi:hypothetical protein
MIGHARVEPTRRSGLKASPERRRANNKMARWGLNKIVRKKIEKNQKSEEAPPCFSHRKDKATIVWARRIARPLAARS